MSVLLLGGGCVAPHYAHRQLILFGQRAPVIAGPDVAMIQEKLLAAPAPRVNLPTVITAFATTPFKCLGLQGWTDFEMGATASGIVVQHREASDRFVTVDLELRTLEVDGMRIPLPERRYIRVEIYRGRVPIESAMFRNQSGAIRVRGKFVWDSDGWFEIHPQTLLDISREEE